MIKKNLTVGLLVTGAGTATTELLGLGTAVVGNQECAVVLSKSLLQLVLGVLIDVLLVVGDNGLGDGLTDGVDLGSVTTTGNTDTDVDTGELVSADDQEGLVDLKIRAWIVRNRFRRGFFPLPLSLAIRANPLLFWRAGVVGANVLCVP